MRRSADLPDARAWTGLWHRIASSTRRALMLDFDGTLASFTVDRDSARLAPGLREILGRVVDRGDTALAIVSGRRLTEIEERFAGFDLHLFGEHGWEERLPGGARRSHVPSPTVRDLLDAAADSLARRLSPDRLEIKRTGLVVHARGEPPERVRALAREVELCRLAVRQRAELELRPIDGGWELRVRGHDKGTAVNRFAATLGGPAFAVSVGDDDTDEDAFAAVVRFGSGILVGSDDRPTRAHARLPDVEAVRDFLALWADRTHPSGAEPPR